MEQGAWRKVRTAKENDSLEPQPCVECGSTVNVVAHHNDYSKPLDVVWMCWSCHLQHHRAPVQDQVDEAIYRRNILRQSYRQIAASMGTSVGAVFKWINNPSYR